MQQTTNLENTPIPELLKLFLSKDLKTVGKKLFQEENFTLPEKNNKQIAIIGSGPAGLSLATILTLKGFDITIFEGQHKIGGVLRYGTPDFKLDKAILDDLESKLKELGVKIRPNIMIGKNITIDDLRRDGFKAIFIGTGAWTPKKLNIRGESLANVHFAIDYLKSPSSYDLGEKVVVIGAGNMAMDVARTAIRNEAKEVTIFYKNGEDDIIADEVETNAAKEEGIKFEFYKEPREFTAEGINYVHNDDTRARDFKEANSVLVAVGQKARDLIVKNNSRIEVAKGGLIVTDENGKTTREGIFASGNVSTSKENIEDLNFCKNIATSIEEYVNSL